MIKKIFLMTVMLLSTMLTTALNAQTTYVGQPTDDTWVRSNETGSKSGTAKNLEMKTYSAGSVNYYTLMQFQFTAPNDGNRVKSATLRLTTRYKKGDSEVKIYPLNFTINESTTDYAAAGTAIEAAISGQPIATFRLNGDGGNAPTDNISTDYQTVDKWQNTIDLTTYVQTLVGNTFAIVLQKTYDQNNSSQIYSKEATDETLKNSTVFAAADLVPQLTVEYEAMPAGYRTIINTTVDGWIMEGYENYSSTEIELKNQQYEDNNEQKVNRFYGVLHFDMPATPFGKQLASVALRLVSERVKNDRTTDVYQLNEEVEDGTTFNALSSSIISALAGNKLATFTMAGNNNSIVWDNQTNEDYMTIGGWTNHVALDVSQLSGVTSLNLLLDAPVTRDSNNDSNRFFTSESTGFTNDKIGLTVAADKLVPQLILTYIDAEVKDVYIGETGYDSIEEALAAVSEAAEGDTPDETVLTICKNQELKARINVGRRNLKLVGGVDGVTISRATGYTGICFLTNNSSSTLTIENLTLDGQDVDVTNGSLIESGNYGTTILKNVTVKNCKNGGWSIVENKNGGRLTLEDVIFMNCTAARADIFVGTDNVTLKGENTIPAIYVEKSLKLTATGATATQPIELKTEVRPIGVLVYGGNADDFTSTTTHLLQVNDNLFAVTAVAPETAYSHPAMLHTATDITRIKGALTVSPIKDAYTNLKNSVSATYTANTVEWLKRMDANNWGPSGQIAQYADYANFVNAANDAKAAYKLALRYQLGGEVNSANAAVAVLNQWATDCKGFFRMDGYANRIPDPNEYLMLIQAHQFANAAELLRGYNGWQAADFQKFQQWMRSTFADMALLFLENHHNAANVKHYWMNWDLAAMNALLSVGILCDDQALVDYVKNYAENGVGTGAVANAIIDTHADADSDETLAQCQESGRDQGHATLNVTLLGVLCQMAQGIGEDFFTPYKALEMAEYIGKYNLKNDADDYIYDNMPFTEYSNGEVTHTAISSEARGTVRPAWELFWAYAQKNGKEARYCQQWAEQARRKNSYGEGSANNNDDLGFSTLMFMSTDAADYSYTLKVSEAGAATLILPFDATIPAGVECFTLNYTAGQDNVTTTAVTGTLPANTPVLVKADEGEYTFNGTSIWQKAATTTVGALTGVYQKTIVPTGSYLLSVKSGVLGFYKANDANSSDANTAESNRAYLTAESSAPMLTINLGNITGINDATLVNSEKVNSEVYDLQGRKVANPTKGMYIVNGKKVVLK